MIALLGLALDPLPYIERVRQKMLGEQHFGNASYLKKCICMCLLSGVLKMITTGNATEEDLFFLNKDLPRCVLLLLTRRYNVNPAWVLLYSFSGLAEIKYKNLAMLTISLKM